MSTESDVTTHALQRCHNCEDLRQIIGSVVEARVDIWNLLQARGERIKQTDTDLYAALQRYLERANV